MRKKLLGLFSIVLALVLLVACGKKSYEVDFDLNGGESVIAIATQKVKSGGLVLKPTDPTREGYTFAYWALDNEEWIFETAKVSKKMTLVATWKIKEYTVSFDTLGGVPAIAAQKVAHGAKADEPARLPALEGNEFLGWYLGGTKYDFETAVTKDITLVAKWGVKVTFDADGGTPAPAEQALNRGDLAVKPADPTRPNATFLGWFYEGERFEFTTPINQSIKLQARWEFDYAAIMAALVAHYADTFENLDWNPTEDVELLAEISGLPITWSSSEPEYFSNDGKVTQPPYSVGDKTIMLRASITPEHIKEFYFIVKALEQTTEELLDEILRVVTIVPSTPSGYQEQNFDVTTTYKIGEENVAITWTTSDETAMLANGQLVPFGDAPEKEVTLTASITYNEVTRTKEVLFLVKGVTSYSSLLEAFIDDNKEEKVMVTGVRYFTPIKAGVASPGGYYVISADNQIGFVYGNPPADLKADKLYDVIFDVDIYFGSYQMKAPAFINEREGELPTVTPTEMTLDEIVALPKPLEKSFNHQYIKLVNVKVRVVDPNDRYKTFLVNQDLADDAVLTDMNSLMIYYQSNIEVVQGLDGKNIDEILLINNGYRTNNVVWYVNYIGDGSDIVLSPLTDAESVQATKEQLEASIPFKAVQAGDLGLIKESLGTTIAWTSSDEAVIDPTTGMATLPAEPVTVTLTATITKGEESLTFTREVWVGTPEKLEISPIADLIAYEGNYDLMLFKVKGVVTGATGDRSFTIYDGVDATVIRTPKNVALDFGFEYTIIGTKSVYNGLIQLQQIEDIAAIKGEAKELETPILLVEADLKDHETLVLKQAHLVSINVAEITNIVIDEYSNVTITLKVGTVSIDLRWDSRVAISQEAKDKLGTFVVGNIVNIVGAPLGWYNGPQLGYNDASQIQLDVPETDESKVAAAVAALNLPESTNESLVLPTEGVYGTTITWVSSHPEVIANDGTLTLPEANVEVTLTATVTLNEASQTVDFVVLVKVTDLLTVKQARAEAAETVVQFEGIVTGFTDYSTAYSNYDKVFVEDSTGAIVVYRAAFPEDLKIGDKFLIVGKLGQFNGLIQIAQGATVTLIDSDNDLILPVEVTNVAEINEDFQAKRIDLEGTVVSVSANGQTMVVKVGENEITVRSNSDSNAHIVNAHLLTAVIGQEVNLNGIHVDWHNGAQLLPTTVEQIVFVELSDEMKVLADLNAIVLPEEIASATPLTLPVLGANGSTIVWSSNNEAVISADGTVVLPEEEISVILTATATLNAAEAVKTFTIAVKPAGTPTEQEIAYEDFESYTSTNSYTVDPLTAGDYTIVYGNTVSTASPVYGSMHVLIRVAKNTSNVGSITYKTSETPITKVSFQARYTHSSVVVTVQFSNDGGATWGEAVGVEGLTTTYSTVPFEIASNVTNANTFRILVTTSEVQTSNRDLLLDDIRVYGIV